MGFQIDAGIPAITVFIQGILSFFSPCVLPLVPLYVSYLAGGAKQVDEEGNIHYPRGKVLVNTLFFVLGISGAFFLLGFGFTALGMFFQDNRIWFARISGIIMIMMGLYQLGIFGQSRILASEHRLPLKLDKWVMGPLPALLLGFTFSFAWTPCVGPTLGSVLLMAGSSGNAGKAAVLIGVYTLGFVLPFLAVGLFTGSVLDFFRKHGNVVKYTVKIGAVLLILMGIMTITGFMNGMTDYLSDFGGLSGGQTVEESEENEQETIKENREESAGASAQGSSVEGSAEESSKETLDGTSAEQASQVSEESASTDSSENAERETVPAPDFTLTDQYGNEHTLSDYQGKTIFLNFWATWCPPCRSEMPEIQKLYEDYGSNEKDLIVLGIAAPGYGDEGTVEEITEFLNENEYTFPVVMDETGEMFYRYGISAFPTTFMIDAGGNVYGYVQGAMTGDIMESIVQQTMDGYQQSAAQSAE
ncbi:MAG: redoxin family protein [Lachnospiraceae bacterium]|nr:redoxin family protein [Lachnospiraceae bacterium]